MANGLTGSVPGKPHRQPGQLLQADQSKIDEPGLRRDEPFDLRAHRAGIEIVDDKEPRRVVDEALMRLAIGGRDHLRIVASEIVFSASSKSSSFHCSKLKPFGEKLADEK